MRGISHWALRISAPGLAPCQVRMPSGFLCAEVRWGPSSRSKPQDPADVLLARCNHLQPRTTGPTPPADANSPADSTPSCRAFSLPEYWTLGTVSCQPPRSLAELTPRPAPALPRHTHQAVRPHTAGGASSALPGPNYLSCLSAPICVAPRVVPPPDRCAAARIGPSRGVLARIDSEQLTAPVQHAPDVSIRLHSTQVVKC
jgi:hypothetical protein